MEVQPSEWSRRLRDDPGSLLLLGYLQEEPVGFLFGHGVGGVFEGRLAGVLPEHRGAGVGSRLLERQEELAAQQGFDRIRWAVANESKALMRLNLLFGMRIVGCVRDERQGRLKVLFA